MPSRNRTGVDERDLAAIVINDPDENGKPADEAAIVAHIASLFGCRRKAAKEAS
jgi:hypothetical protein